MRNGLSVLRQRVLVAAAIASVLAAVSACAAGTPSSPPSAPVISPITDFSSQCPGQNDEVEQAVDPSRGYVYEEWMGCDHLLAVAASADGGMHFGPPVVLADSAGGWDPSIAVAPNGTVYAAFMRSSPRHAFPVVEASFDHGATFPQVSMLVPAQPINFGDRDFTAVGPTGTVYLTWDYGPSAARVTLTCGKGGSCAFATGDLNIVMQTSTTGGRSWTPMVHVSPGYPASGADSAPLLVEPDGRIDVDYQGYHMTSLTKLTMSTASSFFTSSADGGTSWSAPAQISPAGLSMDRTEWWIDGDVAADTAGNLYATWDSQVAGRDVGWLAVSTNHGRTWSRLLRVTPDTDGATHIVQVAGGSPGIAYVGWLADSSPQGYALYLRPFSISKGWLSAPMRISRTFGNPAIWPGDTFGISTEPAAATGPHAGWPRVVVSWGSAVGGLHAYSQDRAAVVAFPASLGR